MATNPQPIEKPSKADMPSGFSTPTSAMRDTSRASVFTPSEASQPVHAMDGSQFHGVIEEQTWSDLPPTREEQMPWRAHQIDAVKSDPSTPHEPGQISVGPG